MRKHGILGFGDISQIFNHPKCDEWKEKGVFLLFTEI
jgi:hypothetical protein